jgi:glycine/D-amino acid oxidase-like deaminating enzyme
MTIPVVPRRIGLARAGPGEGAALPTCIDDTLGAYFRPEPAGGLLFGVSARPETEVGRHPAPLRQDEIDAAVTTVRRRVPALDGKRVEGTRAGLDGYTPDRRPIIGPAGPDGLYLCTGFSGGGFKMAPAVGELVAAELIESRAAELLEPYRLERFANGRPIESEHPYDRM